MDANLSCDELKSRGNECFIRNEYEEAEALYTEALEKHNTHRVALLTNRAAARLGRQNYVGSLEDSNSAIEMDPTWTKAYYRKSMALEKLGRNKECFDVWQLAANNCESTPWLLKQLKNATVSWTRIFRKYPVESVSDFTCRFKLLIDSRERLSTMAHFWNESSQDERLQHFQYLLTVIGGEGELSEHNRGITADMMHPMPLHNYDDLPRSHIECWCEFFGALTSQEKTSCFKQIWDQLRPEERDAVVADLKLFVSRALEMRQLLSGQTESSEPDLD